MPIKGLTGIALLILLGLVVPIGELVKLLDPKNTERWLQEAGSLPPVLFVLLMATVVVLSPVPSLPLTLAAGAFLGPFQGGLYSIIGGVLRRPSGIPDDPITRASIPGASPYRPHHILHGMLRQALDQSGPGLATSALRVLRHRQLWRGPNQHVPAPLRPRHCYQDDASDSCLHLFRVHPQRRPYFDSSNGSDLCSPFFLRPALARWIEKYDFLGLGHHFRHLKRGEGTPNPNT